jgi:16S rRNA (cytidine1402-2'-O)-methyltransferase
MFGNLYIVATPIGNLQDISLRAIETLKNVDFIACEDTRKTAFLLKKLGVTIFTNNRSKLVSYYEQNEFKRIPEIINCLKNGLSMALVSDAGTPTISDPGFKLLRDCILEGIRVESIPGASSVISALVSSGLPTDKFLFLGYLPKKEGHRKTMLLNLESSLKLIKATVIIFEAPHRIIKTLEELKNVFSDIDIVLCRELTKIHEEIRREKITSSLGHFNQTNPKGEFVILFNLG